MANETKPESKSVVLKAGESVKHLITFGGFLGLYLRPTEPTAVSADVYAKLQEDVGFKNLVKAGKVLVEK
jgi:hypothetical protein